MAVFVYGFLAHFAWLAIVLFFPWADFAGVGLRPDNMRMLGELVGWMHLVHLMLVVLMAVQIGSTLVFRRRIGKTRMACDVLALLIALMLWRGTSIALPLFDRPQPQTDFYDFRYDPDTQKWWWMPPSNP